MSDFRRVQDLAGKLPEVERSTSWGTPALKVRGKMFIRQHEDDDLIVLKIDKQERAALARERPDTFVVTPHYENYQYVLVRTADLASEELGELIAEAWRMCAPKKLIKAFDEG